MLEVELERYLLELWARALTALGIHLTLLVGKDSSIHSKNIVARITRLHFIVGFVRGTNGCSLE